MRFAMCRAQTNRHNRRGSFARLTVPILILISLHLLASPARAWDSHTHRFITRLAVKVLPPSELKTFFLQNEKVLEQFSVEPDSKLKRNHYSLSVTNGLFSNWCYASQMRLKAVIPSEGFA
jgi:hypothetical protein